LLVGVWFGFPVQAWYFTLSLDFKKKKKKEKKKEQTWFMQRQNYFYQRLILGQNHQPDYPEEETIQHNQLHKTKYKADL